LGASPINACYQKANGKVCKREKMACMHYNKNYTVTKLLYKSQLLVEAYFQELAETGLNVFVSPPTHQCRLGLSLPPYVILKWTCHISKNALFLFALRFKSVSGWQGTF